MNDSTLYEILEINPRASAKEIKSGFRILAQKLHPDKNNNSVESQIAFHLILNAYNILIEPVSRSEYDTYLYTSSVLNRRVKTGIKNLASDRATSLEYFYTQLNFILWEIEDILSAVRRTDDRTIGGKTIKQWMLEILLFLDRWILEPAGFTDYFYEARKIDKVKLYSRIGMSDNKPGHLPYASFEDYFYDIRKRMNKFIDKIAIGDLIRISESLDVSIVESIKEVMRMSYHYLGSINKILKGEDSSIDKFVHTSKDY